MTRLARLILITLSAASALAGCDSSLPAAPPGSKLNAEAIATRDTPPEQQFKGVLAGRPVHLLVHNCKVYKVDRTEGENVAWTLVLEGEFYPLPTSCIRQSLTESKGVVTAFIGRQAFGAGGCCTGTPEYRSSDGLNWKPR
ncbi:hypothetical protein JL37_00710 [Achromobacter sp. RTa]|uniref:hypothetical protein n=1 Tax=Achromobacter sp. RTa TaxID=1532557 RepID=UPI0005104C49|nr:hypothetical protein [Achromobacter sp. RTa]KGE01777.1 hypothetical protein JL37_00710 [Achromobacter sp. RTa]